MTMVQSLVASEEQRVVEGKCDPMRERLPGRQQERCGLLRAVRNRQRHLRRAVPGVAAVLVVVALCSAGMHPVRGGGTKYVYESVVPEIQEEYEALRPKFVDIKPLSCSMVPKDRAIFFHHIPKSAGGSVRTALTEWYRKNHGRGQGIVCSGCQSMMGCNYRKGSDCSADSELKSPCNAKKNPSVVPLRKASTGLVMDHAEYGFERILWKGHVPDRISRITMWRDPVSIHASWFNYIRGLKDPYFMTAGFDKMTCADFVAQLDHWMAKRAEAIFHVHPAVTFHIWMIYPCGLECHCKVASGNMTEEEMVLQSINHLRAKFDVVGITEELTDFLNQVGKITNTPPPKVIELKHQASNAKKQACIASLKTEQAHEAIRKSKVMRQYALVYLAAKEIYEVHKEQLANC